MNSSNSEANHNGMFQNSKMTRPCIHRGVFGSGSTCLGIALASGAPLFLVLFGHRWGYRCRHSRWFSTGRRWSGNRPSR